VRKISSIKGAKLPGEVRDCQIDFISVSWCHHFIQKTD